MSKAQTISELAIELAEMIQYQKADGFNRMEKIEALADTIIEEYNKQ